MSHFFSKAGGGFEGPVHRTRYIEIPFWSQLVDHDPSNEPDLDVFISIELPAPSNRSPPATFKSAKATRGDLLEVPGICYILSVFSESEWA